MVINKERLKEVMGDWCREQYGYIFEEEGGIANSLIKLIRDVGNKDVDMVASGDADCVIDMSDNAESDGFEVRFDSERYIVSVPPELQEKIRLATEYVLSGFDKIQIALSHLPKELQANRKGVVVNAQKELYNCKSGLSEESKQVLIGCINDVGNAVEQIKESMIAMCDKVEAVPKDRKKRLFRTHIDDILGAVEIGRASLYDYVYASGVYTEINLKIGRKDAAINRMQEAVEFLSGMRDEERFKRVEQWNKEKDLFWETGVDEQIDLLKDELGKIRNDSGMVIIKEEEYDEQ